MKLAMWVVLFIICCVAIGVTALAWKADSIIKHHAETHVATLSNNTFKLQIGAVDVSYFPLGFELKNIDFNTIDSTYIDFGLSSALVTFTASKIDISDIDIFSIIFGSQARFHLQIDSPHFTAYNSHSGRKKSIKLEKKNSKRNSYLLKSLFINNAQVSYVEDTLKFEAEVDYKGEQLSSDNFINDMKVASNAKLRNVSYQPANGLHHIKVSEINYDGKGQLTLFDMLITTAFDKYELGHVLGHQATWYELQIDSISALNSNSFFEGDTLAIEKVEVAGLTALMFRDKRLQFPNIPDKPMIKEMINKIKLPLIVDEFNISEGHITYQEHVTDFDDAGTIYFEELMLKVRNLTTLYPDSEMRFEASALLMGRGLIEIEGFVPLAKNISISELSGIIYPHDLTIYNPMLNNVAGVHLTSGAIKKSTFQFTYDDEKSKGIIYMAYDNLNVKFIDSNGDISKNKLDYKLKNFIVNSFIIKNDNLRAGDMRIGEIKFQRDPKKSMMNFWWKSLLSGIKSSIGISPEKAVAKVK
jgi:hypothetical protein